MTLGTSSSATPATTVASQDRVLVASTENSLGLSSADFFYGLLRLVEQEYVDPVTDAQKLAVGGVRGMVMSLSDPHAQFMDEDQFRVFEAGLSGTFEGVGIEVETVFDPEALKKFFEAREKIADWNVNGRKEIDGKPEELPEIDAGGLLPDVIVRAVMPGSPAEQAGLKPGDRIENVGGKWLISRDEVDELNDAFERIRRNQMDREEYLRLRRQYMERTENNVSPSRAREKLTQGSEGTLQVRWERPDGTRGQATLPKRKTVVPPLEGDNLRFVKGVDEALKRSLGSGTTTFDLRNSGTGDFTTLIPTLSAILPAGTYGEIRKSNAKQGEPLTIEQGAADAKKVTLIVDDTTRGVARVFAYALHAAGVAELQGKLSSEPNLILEVFRVPGGSGYVIPTGIYVGTGGTK